MEQSRARKFEHFYSLCKRGKVLDVGVEGQERRVPDNLFLKTFRYPGEFYTGLGINDLTDVAARHPDKRFKQYSGRRFPFGDHDFDWVFSNAVIEHVGDGEMQLQFVNEMLRVGKNVFFTTPNKYFPIETHTNIPLAHWHDGLFYCLVGRRPLVTENSLYLFSNRRLEKLMKQSNAKQFEIHRNRIFGYTMTFTVVSQGPG